jgi:hypothetical protein
LIENFQGNGSVLLLGHLVLLTSHKLLYLLGERKGSVYVPPLPSTLRDSVRGCHPLRLVKTAVLPCVRFELAYRCMLQNPVPSLNISKFGHIIYQNHCATSHKVAGSIPDGVTGIVH